MLTHHHNSSPTRACERSAAILERKAPTALTLPPTAALTCSDSTTLIKHTLSQNRTQARLFFGTFSFERKEKVHLLTVIYHNPLLTKMIDEV
ncbi:hypothetical protein HDC91_000994 [Mucilaginibacter sp. AK015]|nr:hypothetical protein [Mucilaginibacter sp. AK015]